MRKLIAIILSILMMLSAAVCVSAEESETEDIIVMLTVDATRMVLNGNLKIDADYFNQYDIAVTNVRGAEYNKYLYYVTVDSQNAKNILTVLKNDKNFGHAEIDEGDTIYDKILHLSFDGNYTYKTVYSTDGGVYGYGIVEYVGAEILPSTYTLSSYIDGFNVQYVSKGAFKNIDTLKTLIIKGSTTLKSRAFYNCRNLKTVKANILTSLDSDSVGYYKDKIIKGFKLIANTNTDYKGCLIRKSDNASVYFAEQNGFDCVLNIKTSDYNALNFEKAGAAFRVTVDGKSASNWKSSDSKVVKITKKGKAELKGKGEALLTAKLKSGKSFKRWINISPSRKSIYLDNNPITVKTKTVKASAKKNNSFSKSRYLIIKNAKGMITFSKKSGSKKITVNAKTGKLTVKKGLKKGKTYKVKINVKAKGNSFFKSGTRTVTVKVKVK